MSQQQIPQPDVGSPALDVRGTDNQPSNVSVSGVGNSGPPSGEAVAHVGASNNYDPVLHQNWVATDTFTWTRGQIAGHMLWYCPIHPRYSNRYIKWISQIYNAWAGGLDYRFKIAGTGFHAGALMAVRLPPNIKPWTLKTLQDLTPFEYVVYDPKMLEMACEHIIDQRIQNFHWMDYDENNPSTFGGWIAVYVMIPLNTSSSGSPEISIQVYCKASPELRLLQMRPNPETDTTPKQHELDVLFSDMSYQANIWQPSQFNPSMVVLNNKIKSINDHTEVRKLDGTGLYNDSQLRGAGFNNELSFSISDSSLVTSKNLFHCQVDDENKLKNFKYQAQKADDPFMYFYVRDKSKKYFGHGTVKELVMPGNKLLEVHYVDGTFSETYPSHGELIVGFVKGYDKHLEGSDNPSPPLPVEESLVVFRDLHGTNQATQSHTMWNYLQQHPIILPEVETLVFTLFDEEAHLPVRFIRLWPNGLMSTNASKDDIIFRLDQRKFSMSYTYRLPATDPLPLNASHSQNALLLAASGAVQFGRTKNSKFNRK